MANYYGFPANLTRRRGVAIIDEIDAHMRPDWQRRIIPTLVQHLPNCQFFVSAHSPFVLAGLLPGQAHLLIRDDKGHVASSTNDEATVAWSVDEIARWLFGMRETMDYETEKLASELRSLRDATNLNDADRVRLETLRDEIHGRITKKS